VAAHSNNNGWFYQLVPVGDRAKTQADIVHVHPSPHLQMIRLHASRVRLLIQVSDTATIKQVPEGDDCSWARQLPQCCLLQGLQLPQPLLQRCWVELQRINLQWNR
jgi:hypothetical protein